ncbi:MAG: metal-dependent hydrolase [Anaerolineaceae bacterium]|nr:metal-dependent hydrolase [Anaerolineaceae bacterium]
MSNRFIFYGHACLGLELDGYNLLVDPWFSGNPQTKSSADDLHPDYILITHAHGDHLGDVAAIAKRSQSTVIGIPEILHFLEPNGIKGHPLQLGGGFRFPFGYLKMTLALHSSSLPGGGYGGNPAGFLLTTLTGQKIYMAGDTGLFYDMKLIGEEGLSLAALPIGDNYTMGPADALRAVKLLVPKQVVPIHYNSFDLIQQDPHLWKEQVEKETSAKVFVLEPGESLNLE